MSSLGLDVSVCVCVYVYMALTRNGDRGSPAEMSPGEAPCRMDVCG